MRKSVLKPNITFAFSGYGVKLLQYCIILHLFSTPGKYRN